MTYQYIVTQNIGQEPTNSNSVIKRIADNAFIPMDPANTDYQEYLAWLEQGNTPLPAEEQQ